MYTMKIILFDIFLICAIAEIFAKWSTTNPDMTVMDKTDLLDTDIDTSQEEAVRDIMDILNSKKYIKEDFVGLQDLPLEKLLANSLPPAAKLKKPKKKKKKVINNLPVYPNSDIKYVEYQPGNIFKPYYPDTTKENLNTGGQGQGNLPINIPKPNIPNESRYVPKQNMPDVSQDKPKVQFVPPTGNGVVKFEDLPYILPNYEPPPGFMPKKHTINPKAHFGVMKQQNPITPLTPQTKKESVENFDENVNKIIILDLYPNARLTKFIKGRIQERDPDKYSLSNNNEHIVNWQNRYNNLLKLMKIQSDKKAKKLFRDGDPDAGPADLGTPPEASTDDAPDTDDNQENHISLGEKVKEKTKLYYQKLKKLIQYLIAKFMHKSEKDVEEEKEQARQGHYRHLRAKRDTQAGYTQDPDTCQKYNENLQNMWSTLSKYLNATDDVNDSALHNIAVMVEAYLDHHKSKSHEEPFEITREEKKKDKISEVLRKIKKLLGPEDAPDKVKEMVLENFKPEYEDDECKQMNEDNLVSSIALSYKNYLDNAKCRGDYDTGLLRGKALLRGGAPEKTEGPSSQIDDSVESLHKSILDEDESSEQFNRGKHPAHERTKQIDDSYREKRSLGRLMNLNKDARYKTRSGVLRRRRPKKSTKKRTHTRKRPHMRSDESCVKYANRKFLITLRTSIERFMNLLDCQHDDTLRTSNRKRKPVNTNTYVPIARSSNEGNSVERKFYSDTDMGPREQNEISHYLSHIKDKNPARAEKPVYVVHSTAYKKPVLLKFKKPIRPTDPIVVHHETKIVDRTYPQYNSKSKYNLDGVYKSFIDSSGVRPKNAAISSKYGLDLTKPKQKLREPSDNLFEIIKKKIADKNSKSPIDTAARQNEDSNPFSENKPNITNDDNAGGAEFHYNHGTPDGESVNFNAMGDIINQVHNTSLSNPQVDMLSIASESEKGYVELSYLVKYPKSIVYRPQYLVKNILQYDDFVKVASQIYVTDDDRQLLKIVRYLPDNTTQTLFETQDFKSPLEIHDINDDKKPGHVDDITTDAPHNLRKQLDNDTEYPDYGNQTISNVTAETTASPLREDEDKEDEFDLNLSANHNAYRFHDDSDYSMYDDRSTAENINETTNSTDIDRTGDNSDISLNTDNSTESDPLAIFRTDNGDFIDERIIEILNASLNSGEFVNHQDELNRILNVHDNTTKPIGKSGDNIDAESIADYLRFKLNGDANLSSASHAYLKQLEAQGVSTTALTKSMLRSWWESWKNKLSTKVQSIAGRVSGILKNMEHATTTTSTSATPGITEAPVTVAAEPVEAEKEAKKI